VTKEKQNQKKNTVEVPKLTYFRKWKKKGKNAKQTKEIKNK
jgi:hypothetical protein